ncbi:hypothetical protein ACFS5O_13300 [Fictibacillus nanhaiensis]
MNNLQRCITGETFGAAFIRGDFPFIYDQTSSNFKKVVSVPTM